MEETKQFFGRQEYVGIEDTGRKTPSGVSILKVLFVDGTSQITTQTVFDIVKASVAVDFTQERELILLPLIQRIFSLMTDYDLKHDDVNALLDRMANTYNTTLSHATNSLYGVRSIGDLTMLKINEVNDKAEAAKKQ